MNSSNVKNICSVAADVEAFTLMDRPCSVADDLMGSIRGGYPLQKISSVLCKSHGWSLRQVGGFKPPNPRGLATEANVMLSISLRCSFTHPKWSSSFSNHDHKSSKYIQHIYNYGSHVQRESRNRLKMSS